MRPIRSVAVAVLMGTAAVLVAASPAQAHNYLVSSTPAEGSTITELPAEFSVTTNEALLDLSGDGAGFALEVVDHEGEYYGDGCVSITDATLATGASLGDAGDYTLLWQLVSEDGHTVSGLLPFTWAPAPGVETVEGSTTPPDCGGTATGGSLTEGTATGATVEAREDADLGDVLWIGGAVLAVLIAAGVTVLVAGRRRRAE